MSDIVTTEIILANEGLGVALAEANAEIARLTAELSAARENAAESITWRADDLNAQLATARAEALEEAAKLAEGPADGWGEFVGGTPERDKIAAAIRAMKVNTNADN